MAMGDRVPASKARCGAGRGRAAAADGTRARAAAARRNPRARVAADRWNPRSRRRRAVHARGPAKEVTHTVAVPTAHPGAP